MKVTRNGLAVRWGSRIATVAVSAGLLYYFLRNQDWLSLWQAGKGARFGLAWVGTGLPLFIFWGADAAFTVKSFAWIGKPTSFFSYLVIKAAAYLLNMVNIVFSTGGVFLYFMRKTGISARAQAGLLGWRLLMAVFGYTLVYAALAVLFAIFEPELAAKIHLERWTAVIIAMGALMIESNLFFIAGRGLILLRLHLPLKSEFWTAFKTMRTRHWLLGFAYTAPQILANSLGMYLTARAFDINVPPLYFMFCIPAVVLISALPVAFGGFGTTTAAWMVFFSAYGDSTDIAAATLFIPGARLLIRASIGAIFLPMAGRELSSLRKKDE